MQNTQSTVGITNQEEQIETFKAEKEKQKMKVLKNLSCGWVASKARLPATLLAEPLHLFAHKGLGGLAVNLTHLVPPVVVLGV